jgi:3',5'-cyclic AMP phosphodiesterase CpdA
VPVLVLAQVSDLHLDLSEAARSRAERVLGQVAALDPPADAVVVTGDVADHGAAAEYEQARELLALVPGAVVCPGNHDTRPAFARVLLGRSQGEQPVNQVHRVGGAALVLCDSSVPGEDWGDLSDRTLGWLDETLTGLRGEGPVLVALHHPPVPLHLDLVDAILLRRPGRLAGVLTAHDHVSAVLCGHAHAAAATTFAGRPLLVAPGVRSTVRLPLEPGPELDYAQPPAFALHVLDDDGRLTTHVRAVALHPEPTPDAPSG